jgi:hypothetical protein
LTGESRGRILVRQGYDGRVGGQVGGKIPAEWEKGGKKWEEKPAFAQEIARVGKRAKKFPAKVGTESAVFLRK